MGAHGKVGVEDRADGYGGYLTIIIDGESFPLGKEIWDLA